MWLNVTQTSVPGAGRTSAASGPMSTRRVLAGSVRNSPGDAHGVAVGVDERHDGVGVAVGRG